MQLLLFFSVYVDHIDKVMNNEQYAEDVGTSANESRFLEDPGSMLDQVFFFVDVLNKEHR